MTESKVFRLLVFLFIISNHAFAQEQANSDFKGTAVYLSGGGAAFGATLNAERVFYKKASFCFSGRIGFGAHKVWERGQQYNYVGVPIGLNAFLNRRSFHIEVGVALSYAKGVDIIEYPPSAVTDIKSISNKAIYFTPSIGYRFQKATRSLFFRLAYTPRFKVKELTDWQEFQGQGNAMVYTPLEISLGYFFGRKKGKSSN